LLSPGRLLGASPLRYSELALPIAEKELIARIRRQSRVSGQIRRGIGDDSAVVRLPAGHEALVTTDFSLEGVHFRREWHSPEVVGHRCLTRGLSDIAAMGGGPIAAFLSLALPRHLPQSWADRFLAGFLRLAGSFQVPLAGGDIAQSPAGVLADIMILGSAPRGKAVLRSGARVGDGIYVTGQLGGASAALDVLLSGAKKKLKPEYFARHFHPIPRLAVGELLRSKGVVSAMIDLSDGLSTDLSHICEESGVGAELDAGAMPLAWIGRPTRQVERRFALHGGDDYELLFTAGPGKRVPRRIAGVPVTFVGTITRRKKIVLMDGDIREELKPQGWQHFT
jgi:thiamine-monophosphate kinase